MIKLPPLIIALVVMSATLLAAPFAHADKVAQYKKPQSFEATDDFYAIEGAGLYQGADARALGREMWDHSSRNGITQQLIKLHVNSKSPVLQAMIKAVLLSEAEIKELDDYDEINAGEDLLTIRMIKLMQGGYYKDAMELYSVAIESPHHQDIAKAGILAMLGNGEKSIACLEMKTLGNMNMADPFWPAFMGYCNYTLTESPSESAKNLLTGTKYEIMRVLAFNKDFIFPYTAESFAKLSLLERNTLVAEGRIEAPEINKETINDIPATDLYALLSLETLSAEARALLIVKAVEWGILPIKDLNEFYEKHKEDKSILGGIVALYGQVLSTEDDEQKITALKEAINKAGVFNDAALLPFASVIASGELDEVTVEEMTAILPVLYRANRELPLEMLNSHLDKSEENKENPQYFKTLKVIEKINKLGESHKISEIMQNLSVFHKNTQDGSDFVIENLDIDDADVDNADKVYEKDVDAALQKEHIDALNALRKLLIRRSRADALGETVLLSIELLHEKPLHGIDEDLFKDSTSALENVKLKEFSRKMAIERLIGDEEKI